MGVPSDAAVSSGDYVRQMTEVRSDVAQSRTARRGEATSVGKKGMRFHSGGSAVFEDGGGVEVRDGGDVNVKDGGSLTAEYPSGRSAVHFGPLTLEATGAPDGFGLLVQADDDSQGRDVFRAKYTNGERLVFIGQDPEADASGAVDRFAVDAAKVSIHAHGDELRIQSHHGNPVRIYGGDGITGAADVRIASFDGGLINIQSADSGDIQVLSDGRLWLFADGDLDGDVNGNFTMIADGTAALGGISGTYLQPESTGLAANMHMAADGRVYRSTSTRRYKTDIRDASFDPEMVLQLQPRSWLPGAIPASCPEWLHSQHKDRPCPAEQDPEPADPNARRQVGFVAEELVDAGLGDFVEFNADGEPEAIYYDRLTAALIPVIQNQQQQIAALTERVDALESTQAAGS